MFRSLVFIAAILMLINPSFAQEKTKIQLLGANVSKFDEKIAEGAQRLIGKVRFKHKDVLMNCDSAWLYANNKMIAYSRVRIIQGDTLSVTADRLDYNGDTRMAELYDNIRLRDKELLLETDRLQYDMSAQTAMYMHSGKIINKEENNTLSSVIGIYHAESKVFHFKKKVLLVNPQYTIHTDTLQYNTHTETAYFLGPTDITAKNNFIYCENGWYDTKRDIAQFHRNAYIWNDHQKLNGDSLYYDRKLGYGEAFNNVNIHDTLNSFNVSGDYGKHLEQKETSFVTGHALFTQISGDDTLYLGGDTLIAVPDTLNEKKIMAYHNVLIYKKDLQGSCDSMLYAPHDSLFYLFTNPVLWSGENQISGTFIRVKTYDGALRKIWIDDKAMIISEVDTAHYNQIKGRTMTGIFKENELVRVDVNGNGQLIYYGLDESDSTTAIIGVNKAVCSDLTIRLTDRKVRNVTLLNEPDSKFIPLDKSEGEALRLEGFEWKNALRPENKEAIIKRK